MEDTASQSHILSRMGQAIYKLMLAGVDVYAAFILFYLLARMAVGESWWLVALTSNFIHWLLLPAFCLIPLVVWRRRWIRAGLLTTHALTFVLLFGGLFIPKSQAVDRADLKVMTFNIASYRSDPAQIVARIRSVDADVIALQEVGVEHARYIQAALKAEYPYQSNYVSFNSLIVGKLLLSRYPILEAELYSAATEHDHIQALIDVNGTPVQVFVIHFWIPEFLQDGNIYRKNPVNNTEYDLLLERLDPAIPTLILGDFNMTDQSAEYQRMAEAGLTDVFREVGWGFGATFPAIFAQWNVPMPIIRIDYVWTSPHWTPLDAEVGAAAGSDHLPLIAYLDLK